MSSQPRLDRNVLRAMSNSDRLRLALRSEMNENLLKTVPSMHPQNHLIDIAEDQMGQRHAIIRISESLNIICGGHISATVGANVSMAQVARWTTGSSSIFQTTKEIYSRVQGVLPCPDWKLRLITIKRPEMEQILTDPLFSRCGYLIVIGLTDFDLLTYIIDRVSAASHKMRLGLTDALPIKYRHPKALSMWECTYHDARWVTIENVMSMRNSGVITLKRSLLTEMELNKYLHHLTTCGFSVCNKLEITLEMKTIVDVKVLLENVISLEVVYEQKSRHFVNIEPADSNKIATVTIEDNTVTIEAGPVKEHLVEQRETLLALKEQNEETLKELKERRVIVEGKQAKMMPSPPMLSGDWTPQNSGFELLSLLPSLYL